VNKKLPLIGLIILVLAWPSRAINPTLFYVATTVDSNTVESTASNEVPVVITPQKFHVVLTWQAGSVCPTCSTTITGYNIYRGKASGGPYVLVGSTAATILTFTDVVTPPNPPVLAGVTN